MQDLQDHRVSLGYLVSRVQEVETVTLVVLVDVVHQADLVHRVQKDRLEQRVVRFPVMTDYPDSPVFLVHKATWETGDRKVLQV